MNGTIELILKVVFAVVAGGIIGWERSKKRHTAGLRTFMTITLGACLAMMLELQLKEKYGYQLFVISAGTVIGLSTISVNTIHYSAKNQIKGLTTSASLWVCGIIGLAIGAGYYLAAGIALAGLYVTISLMPAIEEYLKNRSNHFEIQLELTSATYLRDFVSVVREIGVKIDEIEINPAFVNSGLSVYSVNLSVSSSELKKYKTHAEIIEALRTLEYISHIEELT